MANYGGSRTNALINSKVVAKGGGGDAMFKAMKNATEEAIALDKFELKASKSEHNHSGKRQFK